MEVIGDSSSSCSNSSCRIFWCHWIVYCVHLMHLLLNTYITVLFFGQFHRSVVTTYDPADWTVSVPTSTYCCCLCSWVHRSVKLLWTKVVWSQQYCMACWVTRDITGSQAERDKTCGAHPRLLQTSLWSVVSQEGVGTDCRRGNRNWQTLPRLRPCISR